MKLTTCPRLFEVEAMRDGRLTRQELAAFGRHMTGCRACAQEARALDALVEGVRADAGAEPVVDELHVARERTRLLAAFDHALFAPERRRISRWLLGPAAAVAVVCAFFAFSRSRLSTPAEPASRAVIRAEADTVWSKHWEGDAEVVVLQHGALGIHVNHPSRRGRFVVMLPDGELDDIGTTFRVVTQNGRTIRVAVEEGSVLLRLRGRPPAAVSAGQTWTWTSDERVTLPPEPVEVPASAQTATKVMLDPPRARRVATLRPRAPAARSAAEQSDEFPALVSLLEAGHDCDAASAFLRFVASRPTDPRVEDAAYLRIIALQRCGADDEMKRAARAYLGRYPSGFRRAEVERLSR